MNLGNAYYFLRQLDQAAAMYRRAIQIQPDAGSYSNLGVIYFMTRQYADSVRMFEKAVELEPQNHNWRGNLADAYRWTPSEKDRARASYAQAIGLVQRDLEVNARNPWNLAKLALYEAKSGEPEKARQSIELAMVIAPKDLDVLTMAAEVYAVTGDQQESLECLKSAVQSGYPRFELEANPEFDGLRNDPRYREITGKGKPEASGNK